MSVPIDSKCPVRRWAGTRPDTEGEMDDWENVYHDHHEAHAVPATGDDACRECKWCGRGLIPVPEEEQP